MGTKKDGSLDSGAGPIGSESDAVPEIAVPETQKTRQDPAALFAGTWGFCLRAVLTEIS